MACLAYPVFEGEKKATGNAKSRILKIFPFLRKEKKRLSTYHQERKIKKKKNPQPPPPRKKIPN